MACKKGKKEYGMFLEGKHLTRRQAVLAQCYVCNGEEEGGVDCLGISCPLYEYFPYKGKKNRNFMPESGSFKTDQVKESGGMEAESSPAEPHLFT